MDDLASVETLEDIDMLLWAAVFVTGLTPVTDGELPEVGRQFAQVSGAASFQLSGQCDLAQSPDKGVFFPDKGMNVNNNIHPAASIQSYNESKGVATVDLSSAKVTILEGPKHGNLRALNDADPDIGPGLRYTPNPGYRGADYITTLVEFNGQRIRVRTKIVVVEAIIDGGGYSDGQSGGGAAVDKEANACLYKTKVQRIGEAGDGQGPLNDWFDVVRYVASLSGR